MDLSLFFAGTGGSVPTARRGLPSLLVRRGGDRILFDCGEGTQRQLVGSVGLTDLTEIFLTHFHTDHWLGLPGMLKTFDLRGRERPLAIHGPPGLQALIALVVRMGGRVSYPLHVVELGPTRRAHPRRVPDRAGAGLPSRLRLRLCDLRGSAAGRVRSRGGATARPGPRPGVRPRPARGDDPRDRPRAGPRARLGRDASSSSPGTRRPASRWRSPPMTPTCSSTRPPSPRRSATAPARPGTRPPARRRTLARDAGVGLLALNHVSTRHPPRLLRDEARAIFPRTVIPRDFDSVEIPVAERGRPELHRWEDRGRVRRTAPSGDPVQPLTAGSAASLRPSLEVHL